MSTAVVVKKDGYACIGADSLTKFGSTKESDRYVVNHSKIVACGSTWLAAVGHASFQLVLNSYLSQLKVKPSFAGIDAIFETLRTMHKVLKEEYFLNPTEDEADEFESSQVMALVANPQGIFGIYSLRSVQEYARFYAFGSGSDLALGAMYAVYDDQRCAEEIARIGLTAAAEFDHSTALPLELHTVKLENK